MRLHTACLFLTFLCVVWSQNVVILFTTNVRGNVNPFFVSDTEDGIESSTCISRGSCEEASLEQIDSNRILLGGCVSRIVHTQKIKTQYPDQVLVLDAGAYFWGSSVYSDSIMAECANMIEYDVMNIGSPDLYSGTNVLKNFYWKITPNTDIVNANFDLDPSREKELTDIDAVGDNTYKRDPLIYTRGMFIPSVVKSVNGVNILVIGGINEGVYSYPVAETIAPTTDTGLSLIFRLRQAIYNAKVKEKANNREIHLVVAMLDLDFLDAKIIARQLEDVDLVFYSRFWKTDSKEASEVKSFFNDKTVYITHVNTTSYGASMAQIQFEYNATTDLIENFTFHTELMLSNKILVDPLTPSVEAYYNKLRESRKDIEKQYSDVIASVPFQMLHRSGHEVTDDKAPILRPQSVEDLGCRNFDCALGRLVVNSYLDACLTTHNRTCDIALVNSGMLRAAVPSNAEAKYISKYDIVTLLPYNNLVVTQEVPGAVIKAVLGVSASSIGRGGFLHSNMHVSYFYNREAANKKDSVVEVKLKGVNRGGFKGFIDILDDTVYTVSMPTFIYEGGDGYTHFANVSQAQPTVSDNVLIHNHLSNLPDKTLTPISMDELELCLENEIPWVTAKHTDCKIIVSDIPASQFQFCPTNIDFCTQPPSIFEKADISVDRSNDCKSCSGVGSCALRQCRCETPSSGVFKGVDIIRGDDCGEAAVLYHIASPIVYSITVVTLFTILLCLVLAALILKFRNAPAIKAVSPTVSLIMCGAGILVALGSLFNVKSGILDQPCMLPMWLVTIGYITIFGCLFMRTYRIHMIFNSTGKVLRKVIFSDFDLGVRVGVLLLIDIIILAIYQAVDPLLDRGVILDTSTFQAIIGCKAQDNIMLVVLLVYNGALLLWGVYLAFLTRNVEANFNESNFIGASVYNCFFVAVVVIPLTFILRYTNPNVITAIQNLAILYILTFTLLVVFGPRLFQAYLGNNPDNSIFSPNNPHALHINTNSTNTDSINSTHYEYIRLLETQVKQFGGHISRPANINIPDTLSYRGHSKNTNLKSDSNAANSRLMAQETDDDVVEVGSVNSTDYTPRSQQLKNHSSELALQRAASTLSPDHTNHTNTRTHTRNPDKTGNGPSDTFSIASSPSPSPPLPKRSLFSYQNNKRHY